MTQNKELSELLNTLEGTVEHLKYNLFFYTFPDSGRYARIKYPKHIKFINASSKYRQLALIGGNRIGKTRTLLYIVTAHATGLYPSWWMGKKFKNPVVIWLAGKTNQKTKELLQEGLLGKNLNDIGAGMIPKKLIVDKPSKKQGATDCIETLRIKHKTGGISYIIFKSYEQGRGAFEGDKVQLIGLDEEPDDPSIFTECCMRLIDEHNPGELRCTFTPLIEETERAAKKIHAGGIYDLFVPDVYTTLDGHVPNILTDDGKIINNESKFAIQLGLDDAPHLSEEEKNEIINSCLPHEIEARTKGIRVTGPGAVYQVQWNNIICDPVPIPIYWPKAYGFDTGVKNNAAVWLAQDPETNILYAYAEYYAGYQPPVVHAEAIKAISSGDWMIGAADAFMVRLDDGEQYITVYKDLGLNLVKADKRNRDAGILKVTQLFAAGMLKIYNTCPMLIKYLMKYRRDMNGNIIKQDDHLPDAFRYAVTTGINYLETAPSKKDLNTSSTLFDTRNKYTGY